MRQAFGFQNVDVIVVTCPKRSLVKNSRLPIVMGAPLVDNMMTGAVVLLEAIRGLKCLKPIHYV